MLEHQIGTMSEQPRPEGDAAHLLVGAGDAVIAVPAALAMEIWSPERCHPVPGTPAYVIGIASFRGAPLPLVDLAAALDLRAGEARPRGARASLDGRRAVLISTERFLVGLVVDATFGVVDLAPELLRPPKVVAAGRLVDFAIAETDTPRWGVAAVLDMDTFLDGVRVRS